MASTPPVDPNGSTATQGIDFPAVQRSHEFQRLRSTHRSFVFPLAIAFLVWYLLYVVLAIYAPGFMSTRVVGNVNLGLILGLLQFVTTFGITAAYVSFANRKLDPQATALREDLESTSGHRAGDHQEARP
ncbi:MULTISPECIES: DUF485 domain-containing protein [Kocuria]|uniref:DUF485 domain-containing protein n=1 Tax=Kocuria TaxID=57493 RepID=UPI0018765F9C|nr:MULTISPECIES: DUF485 domain-containing protein [Kocuria]MBX7556723.1 DUF485 domain-containing protein [Streptomyces sp. tea 10]MCT1723691.1 DUF485 domain-containing protein [Kocuria marina]MCT1735002.1 DUF485 domain-containing protein [Kocuria marina]GHD87353.1 hypothetical protein GCM10007061_16530 [Kocuria marina]